MKYLKEADITILILCLFILAMIIAIGHIEEKTSYGLRDVITVLGMLASQRQAKTADPKPTKDNE